MIDWHNQGAWEAYLPEFFFVHLGLRIRVYKIDAIESGMMNYVFRVQTNKGIFFLKHALPGAKAGSDLGPALQTISVRRLGYEQRCISKISGILPDGIKIPVVHHYDPESHLLILSDVAGKGGMLLESNLRKGSFEACTASAVGRFLGGLHRYTWGTRDSVRGGRDKDRNNWMRFLQMRTIGASDERVPVSVQQELAHLCESTYQHHSHDVLLWMDCCPKNVIVRSDGNIGVIDFELASWRGDPAYDLGFFLGHYLIQALRKNQLATVLLVMMHCIHAYRREVEGMPFYTGMLSRVLKFAGATMIYRAIGASRLSYIDADSVPNFIQKAGALLCQEYKDGPDLVDSYVEAALT